MCVSVLHRKRPVAEGRSSRVLLLGNSSDRAGRLRLSAQEAAAAVLRPYTQGALSGLPVSQSTRLHFSTKKSAAEKFQPSALVITRLRDG